MWIEPSTDRARGFKTRNVLDIADERLRDERAYSWTVLLAKQELWHMDVPRKNNLQFPFKLLFCHAICEYLSVAKLPLGDQSATAGDGALFPAIKAYLAQITGNCINEAFSWEFQRASRR